MPCIPDQINQLLPPPLPHFSQSAVLPPHFFQSSVLPPHFFPASSCSLFSSLFSSLFQVSSCLSSVEHEAHFFHSSSSPSSPFSSGSLLPSNSLPPSCFHSSPPFHFLPHPPFCHFAHQGFASAP